MKAVITRLRRLEERLVPQVDLASERVAHVLWERRQRRLKAQGLPFETVEPPYSQGPHMSVAETLRKCRQERLARKRGERETADNGA